MKGEWGYIKAPKTLNTMYSVFGQQKQTFSADSKRKKKQKMP